MEIFWAFFQHIMLRWRDIEKKKFAQKNPDDQGVNTQFALCIQVFGIHYTTGTKFFEAAFISSPLISREI